MMVDGCSILSDDEIEAFYLMIAAAYAFNYCYSLKAAHLCEFLAR